MARTLSTMLALGTSAPMFSLPEPLTGKTVSLADFTGRPLLVVFSCNHCPFVKHIQDGFVAFAREYGEKGLAVVMISANDVEHYPDDSPARMADEALHAGFTFPYLYDETQEVAKAYEAACTPDFFLFDAMHALVYRGQFDDARPGNDAPVTGWDMRAAADAVLAGARPPVAGQKPSLGCNIKWKPGNEPAYYG
ncbi:MAG: thioredoxin family protein [Pseudomonadota bacterium]